MLQQFNQRVQNVGHTAVPQATEVSKTLELLVPQSAFDRADAKPELLVDSMVYFVTQVMMRGSCGRSDLPAEVIQAYCCDFYLGQVAAGGHAQFVENSRHIIDKTLSDVQDALAAIGNGPHLRVAIRLADLVEAEPDWSVGDKGFTVPFAAALAHLDDQFFGIDAKDKPRAQLGRWIAQMRCLKPVPDAEVLPNLVQIAKGRPTQKPAPKIENVARYRKMLQETLSLGLGMAAAKAVDPIIEIGKPGSIRLNGVSTSCWNLRTNGGSRVGVVTGSGATLYAIESEEKPTLRKDLLALNVDNVLKSTMPSAGKSLAHIPRTEIDAAASVCRRLMAAEAVDALMQMLPVPTIPDFVSLRGTAIHDDGTEIAVLMIVADGATRALSVVVDADSAQLVSEPDHAVLATITRAEFSGGVKKQAASA